MFLKYPIIIFLFFIAVILQTSLLPHVAFAGAYPNLIFILFFILIFFKKENTHYEGIIIVFLAGVLLDSLSSLHIPLSMLFLFFIYSAINMAKHFFKEGQSAYLLGSFIGMFLISLFFYQLLMSVGHMGLLFEKSMYIELAYSALVAVLGFFIHQHAYKEPDRQLTLFR